MYFLHKNLKKFIAITVIIAFIFHGNIFLHSQEKDEILTQLEKSKEAYINSQYDSSKVRLERAIGIIKRKKLERKNILGQCYLLLGAIYEKKGETILAEENYRNAKKLGIESIEGVDLDGLPIYERVLKVEIYIETQFQKAVDEYNNGQYDNSKSALEQIIGTIKKEDLEVEKKEILGKCYLLLGATYEKKGEIILAEENYRRAKKEYGIESVEGVELENLKTFKRVVKGIIEKDGKKRKKKFPVLLVVAFGVGVAIGAIFVKPKKKKEFYTLTVTRGEGVDGTPTSGMTTYEEGTAVTYNYSLQSGYKNLVVTLDGVAVSASGTITMNRNHTLNASATPLEKYTLTVTKGTGV